MRSEQSRRRDSLPPGGSQRRLALGLCLGCRAQACSARPGSVAEGVIDTAFVFAFFSHRLGIVPPQSQNADLTAKAGVRPIRLTASSAVESEFQVSRRTALAPVGPGIQQCIFRTASHPSARSSPFPSGACSRAIAVSSMIRRRRPC